MEQMARNAIDETSGHLRKHRYILRSRHEVLLLFSNDFGKCQRRMPHPTAAQSNLNAFAERWVRSAKQECLSKLILFGESSLRRALTEFLEHYHTERNHQGKGNVLLFPSSPLQPDIRSAVERRSD
jgi:putative transposase